MIKFLLESFLGDGQGAARRAILYLWQVLFLIFSLKHVVTPHHNCLNETVLMIGHIICFSGKIRKTIPKLSLLPLLICSSVGSPKSCLPLKQWLKQFKLVGYVDWSKSAVFTQIKKHFFVVWLRFAFKFHKNLDSILLNPQPFPFPRPQPSSLQVLNFHCQKYFYSYL